MITFILIVAIFHALSDGIQARPVPSSGQDQQLELQINYDVDKYKHINRQKDLVITCNNTINKEVPSWEYPSSAGKRTHIKHGINSQLTVKNADDDVAGTYKCFLSYTKPDGYDAYFEGIIEVVSLPLVSIKGGTHISAIAGEKVTLECSIVGGVPNPDFKNWQIKHEDSSMHRNALPYDDYSGLQDRHTITKSTERWQLQYNDKGQAKGKLVIEKFQEDDAGSYTCTAGNNHGNDEKTFTLNVKEPPEVTTKEGSTKIVSVKSTLDEGNNGVHWWIVYFFIVITFFNFLSIIIIIAQKFEFISIVATAAQEYFQARKEMVDIESQDTSPDTTTLSTDLQDTPSTSE